MEINDTSLNESINNQRVSSSFQATTNNIIPEYNSLFNADNFHMRNECRHIHENNRYDNINDSEGDSQNNNDSQRKSNVNPLEISQEITKINMIKKDDISHMDNTNRDNYSYNNLNKEEEDDKIEKDEECEEEEEEEIDEEEKYNENESNDNHNQNYTENNPQETLDDNNSNSNVNDTMSQIAYNIREGMDLMNLENNINDHCSNSSFVDNITLLNSYSNRNSSNINTNRNTNTNINNNNNNLNNRNSELIQNITNHLGNGNNNPLLSQNLNGFMPGQKKINNLQINNNNFEKNEFSKENESILSKQERVLSLSTELNEFEKFIQSPQYVNLEKTFLYANNLFLLKGENNFEIASDEGNEICHKLLDQIECLMVSMNIKGQNRDYRKNFTKAYFYLFEENKLCFLTEILDSAQENTPYIVVNDEQYTFSKEVLNCGNELFNSFCSMIMLLADTVKNIRDGLFYNEIYKIKDKIKLSLIDFDSKWVKYEEKYINELIEIEKKARKLILEGIKIENEITNY